MCDALQLGNMIHCLKSWLRSRAVGPNFYLLDRC